MLISMSNKTSANPHIFKASFKTKWIIKLHKRNLKTSMKHLIFLNTKNKHRLMRSALERKIKIPQAVRNDIGVPVNTEMNMNEWGQLASKVYLKEPIG